MVGIIVTIFIILLIAAVVQAFHAKIWGTKTFGYNYVVTMTNGGKLPDLSQNTKLKIILELLANLNRVVRCNLGLMIQSSRRF